MESMTYRTASAADVRALVALVQSAYRGEASRPDWQGKGLGQAMLAEAERIARDEWGCREMQMTVITLRTELIAWYERRGYRRTGVFKPFPYGDARFGLPKRDALRMEVLRKPLR